MVLVMLAIFGVITGFVVSKFTGIDLYISFFGTCPEVCRK